MTSDHQTYFTDKYQQRLIIRQLSTKTYHRIGTFYVHDGQLQSITYKMEVARAAFRASHPTLLFRPQQDRRNKLQHLKLNKKD